MQRLSKGRRIRGLAVRLVTKQEIRLRHAQRLRAFTLVELLVVISIIGMLAALLLPAVHASRERVRQAVCSSNLRQVGYAIESYHSAHQEYPGYTNVLITTSGDVYRDYTPEGTGEETPVSWVVPLLPQLGRTDLYHVWTTDWASSTSSSGGSGTSSGQPRYMPNPKVYMEILQCPSDPPTVSSATQLSYVVNTGMKDELGIVSNDPKVPSVPADWPHNGIFFDRYTSDRRLDVNRDQQKLAPVIRMSQEFVLNHDGLQYTLLLSENTDATNWVFDNQHPAEYAEQAVGFIWDGSGTVDMSRVPPRLDPEVDSLRINHSIGKGDPTSHHYARPSARHPGGVNVVWCDGRTQFLSQDISYFVYATIMTPNGVQAALPGTPHPGTPIDENLRQFVFDPVLLVE